MLEKFIPLLQKGYNLDRAEARECLVAFARNGQEEESIEFLRALAKKGETADEIIAFAMAMQTFTRYISLPTPVFDICGTGGSGLRKFNVSTAAAFIASAGGVPIAKHCGAGSRGAGSTDFLSSLGCRSDFSPNEVRGCYSSLGLVFLSAAAYNTVFVKVRNIRKKLRARSIFNLIAPLCNPTAPSRLLVGVSDALAALRIAVVIKSISLRECWVVYGEPGIDEVSLAGPTTIWKIRGELASIEKSEFSPKSIGLSPVPLEKVTGMSLEENKFLFMEIISGREQGPLLDLVALNAGFLFVLAKKASSIGTGWLLAKSLIANGRAAQKLSEYQKFSEKARI